MKSCTRMTAKIARNTYPIEKEIFLFTGMAGTYASWAGTGTTEWHDEPHNMNVAHHTESKPLQAQYRSFLSRTTRSLHALFSG
jgi:hypothetical protein